MRQNFPQTYSMRAGEGGGRKEREEGAGRSTYSRHLPYQTRRTILYAVSTPAHVAPPLPPSSLRPTLPATEPAHTVITSGKTWWTLYLTIIIVFYLRVAQSALSE